MACIQKFWFFISGLQLQLFHFYPSSLNRYFELIFNISGPLQIFANAFPVHYSPPTGFHFEVNDDSVPVQVLIFHKKLLLPSILWMFDILIECITLIRYTFELQDNPLLYDYNVEQRVKDFINAAITQVNS